MRGRARRRDNIERSDKDAATDNKEAWALGNASTYTASKLPGAFYERAWGSVLFLESSTEISKRNEAIVFIGVQL